VVAIFLDRCKAAFSRRANAQHDLSRTFCIQANEMFVLVEQTCRKNTKILKLCFLEISTRVPLSLLTAGRLFTVNVFALSSEVPTATTSLALMELQNR
jgi:aspartate carbamoyltransferase catalytic subunit